MTLFSTPEIISSYADNAARMVPGMRDIPKMAGALLAECAPVDARILVLGAGGGLELKTFAEMQPGWRFDGVDPSADMLDLARTTLGVLASRAHLHEGYIDSAPAGPFDGASCLLTLHFLPRDERLATLKAIHLRLKAGAPLVVVHHSFPIEGPDQDKWLRRSIAFAVASGMPAVQTEARMSALKTLLPVLTPQQDTELLDQAGFGDIELFYSAFTFKGWVAYKR